MRHHPWRDLRSREHLTLTWIPMPDGVRGATNGTSAIWLEPRMSQVERRCTLAHELAHIDLGHSHCDDEKAERSARRLTAVRLIDWDDLIDAYRWATSMHEWADELWVTEEVLEDRLRFLHPHERGLLRMIQAARHD